MTAKDKEQLDSQTRPASDQQILLLADDGRMARLLPRVLNDCQTVTETNVLDGIALLGRSQCKLILLNAGQLGRKTVQAVKALRRVGPRTPLVLYGEAFAEIYAQPGLRAGADDYLVWPIPLTELRQRLNSSHATITDNKHITAHSREHPTDQTTEHITNDLPPGLSSKPDNTNTKTNSHEVSASAVFEANGQIETMADYHSLAQLVPQGTNILIEQAQTVLKKVLQVESVRISLDPESAVATRSNDNEKQPFPGGHTSQTVSLTSLAGSLGTMTLTPAVPDASQPMARQAAAFLATLLHLAQRDQTLKRLAITDELTGVYNRRYLEYFLREVIAQSKHQHTEVTLLVFDIDEFKYYNNTYGHIAGDNILRQAVRLIHRCCREHDVVARIGGDEFAVLFWDSGHHRTVYTGDQDESKKTIQKNIKDIKKTHDQKSHPEMAMFMSNRFRRLMMTNDFPGLGPNVQRGVLTISGGLAGFPWDGRTAEELMAQADEALLNAKRSGKNRIYLVGQPKE